MLNAPNTGDTKVNEFLSIGIYAYPIFILRQYDIYTPNLICQYDTKDITQYKSVSDYMTI